MNRLVAALPNKIGPARAFSAEALIKCCADGAELAVPARRALIGSWDNLPDFEQQRLITSDWPVLAGPEMIPILKKMLSGPIPEEGRLDLSLIHISLLAWQTWHHLPGNVPRATGAARPAILGQVTYA